MLRKIAKFFAWLIGGAIGLVVLFYLVVLVINWRDVPPSEEALRFAQMYANRPHVADEQNAFIYMVGISVEHAQEPMHAGKAMLERARESTSDSDVSEYIHPDYPQIEFKDVRKKEMQEIMKSCKAFEDTCPSLLDRKSLAAALKGTPDETLLNRYRHMIALREWQDIYPRGLTGPIPPFGPAMDGQTLSMLDIWLQAEVRGAKTTIAMLDADAKFWRKVLVSSDSLITSMVAVSALKKNLYWTNLLMRRLSGNNASVDVPPIWTNPISDEERLMESAWVGEWVMAEPMMSALPEQIQKRQEGDNKQSMGIRFVTWLMLGLYQPQESINSHAHDYASLIDEYNVPYERLADVISKRKESSSGEYDEVMRFPDILYNPLGKFVNVFKPDFDSYMLRGPNLEGGRRALLATLQLRKDSIPREKVAEALRASPYLNPYTNEPFKWDEATGSVVFEGLGQNEERSKRYSFVY
jgi:hypothetical protein